MADRRTRDEARTAARGDSSRSRARSRAIRPWLVFAAVVIVASVVAVAVQGSREAARERAAAVIPRHSIEDAERLIGRRVVVTGEVAIELPRAFVIAEPEAGSELLVLLPDAVDVPLDAGAPVLVDGVVERFIPGRLPAFGEFDHPALTRFAGQPAIVARGVDTSVP